MTEEKTAIIYARVSDRKQAEKEVSVPTQIELGRRTAAELGAKVLRVFVDDGRSAWKEDNRPNFEASVDFAVVMEATYFIIWDSARFARNKYVSMLNKRALDQAHVELVYISTPIDRTTDMGWAMDGVVEIFNELQSRRVSADTRRSMMRQARMGYWISGKTPYGYRRIVAPDNPKRRKLEPTPEEADLVREIFRMRGHGRGAYAIAESLNRQGLQRRASTWTKQTVLNLLRNRVMIGQLVFNRRGRNGPNDPEHWICVDSHEPIIERELWDLVQQHMDDAADVTGRGSPKSRHAFTGLLRCGRCGSSMQIETGRGRAGKLYFYYRCRTVQQGGECDGRRLRADMVDEWLSEVILSRVLTPESLAEMAQLIEDESSTWAMEHRRRRGVVIAKIKRLQDANGRLFEVLEMYGKDAPNLGDLTRRLRANNNEIKAAEESLGAIDGEQPPAGSLGPEDIEQLGDFLRQTIRAESNAARARAFYRGFVASVTVAGDELVINYSPARLLSQQPERVRSNRKWRPVLASLRTVALAVPLAPMMVAAQRGRPRAAVGH